MVEIVAELGINHNGDINLAKKMIDIASVAGCDYVKFQKRTIESVYTKEELDTPRESPWGTTTREQKAGLELSPSEYKEIDSYCRSKGIGWFASPWDMKSLFLITRHKIPYIKIPSALITQLPFLEIIKKTTDQPIILSTGMSTLDMVDAAVDTLGKDRIYCIMHCTSTYPSKESELNLNVIPKLKQRYKFCKIGFSNHHPGIIFIPCAVGMGAEMVEFHMTLDKLMYGSDQAASFNPDGVFKLVKYIRNIECAVGDGNKCIYETELPIMKKLRKEWQD